MPLKTKLLGRHRYIHTVNKKNLRVNTVSPGLVDTPLANKITGNPIILKASIKMLALDKIGKPKQISNIIKFLINPDVLNHPSVELK